jgi:hypothetical protein
VVLAVASDESDLGDDYERTKTQSYLAPAHAAEHNNTEQAEAATGSTWTKICVRADSETAYDNQSPSCLELLPTAIGSMLVELESEYPPSPVRLVVEVAVDNNVVVVVIVAPVVVAVAVVVAVVVVVVVAVAVVVVVVVAVAVVVVGVVVVVSVQPVRMPFIQTTPEPSNPAGHVSPVKTCETPSEQLKSIRLIHPSVPDALPPTVDEKATVMLDEAEFTVTPLPLTAVS